MRCEGHACGQHAGVPLFVVDFGVYAIFALVTGSSVDDTCR
jgi:hypothetical protein